MLKPEPPINHRLLIETLQSAYGLTAQRLTFVPKGFVTSSYVVEDTSGGRYFLKVWRPSRVGQISLQRLDFVLAFTARLHELGFRVPVVIKTRDGQPKVRVGELTLVLYEYLPGTTLDDLVDGPPDLNQRTAHALAQLHRATPAIGLEVPVIERFTIPFADALMQGLNNLEHVSEQSRPGQQAFKKLMLANQARLLDIYQRLLVLAETARARQPELVLAHTDLNGSNLLLGDDGELYLLDWEGIMLAPAEHDLFIYTGDDFAAFLRAYRAAGGTAQLNAETFGFYFYRRNLEDLTDWFYTILHENTSDAQDELDLRGVYHDCLDGWPYLEAAIQRVKENLD